jgi:hypothetical protein
MGKAILNTDFTLSPAPSNGQYNLPSGVSSLVITVNALSDTATEGPEDIALAFELNRNLSVVTPVHGVIWIDDAETSQPRVRLGPVDRVLDEEGGVARARITRYGSLAAPLNVALTTSGDAIYNQDYTIEGGTVLTLPVGAASVDVVLHGLSDTETEGREKIDLDLANGPYVKDSQAQALIYIGDDDIARVGVATVDDLGAEGDANPAVFRVTRTGDLQDALGVEYNALGTALHGTDYAALAGELTLAPGQSYADLTITPLSDAISDDGDTVKIWLASSDTDYQLETYQDTATIREAALAESVLTLAAESGGAELGPVAGAFRVERSPQGSPYPFTDPVDDNGVWLQGLAGTTVRNMTTADTSDPVLAPNSGSTFFKATTGSWWRGVCAPQLGNLVLEAGTYVVTCYAGDADTSAPFYSVNTDPASGNHVGLTATDPSTPVLPDMGTTADSLINKLDPTIVANFNVSAVPSDGQWVQWTITYTVPTSSTLLGRPLGFLFRKPSGSPTDTGAFDGPLTINFTPAVGGTTYGPALVVNYQVDGGSATPGADYVPLSGSVTIPGGQPSAPIAFLPVTDLLAEGPETLAVSLKPQSGYVVSAAGAAVASITDHPMDVWREQTFGTNATNPSIAGDTMDPDEDDWPNDAEWATLTDGAVFDVPPLQPGRNSGTFNVRYQRRKNTGMEVRVVWSSDVSSGSWSAQGVSETLVGQDAISETIEASIPLDVGKKFARLEVVRP